MKSKTPPDSPLSDSDARVGRYVIEVLRFADAPMNAQTIYDRIRQRWQEIDERVKRMTLGSFEGLLKRTSGYVYSRNREGNYLIAEQMKGAMAIRGL